MNAREKLDVEIERGGGRTVLSVVPQPSTKYDLGYVGLLPDFGRSVRPRIAMVVSGSPAEEGGLKSGDVILAIAGSEIRGAPDEIFTEFVAAVGGAAPGPFRVDYSRELEDVTACEHLANGRSTPDRTSSWPSQDAAVWAHSRSREFAVSGARGRRRTAST